MEIKTIHKLEKQAYKKSHAELARIGFALFFLAGILAYSFATSGGVPNNLFLAIAAVFGGYMAMNIGANDVANNVGPAVGSKALTMGGAIMIAMIFEAAGAFIAGGEVVSTIKGGIIDIKQFGTDTETFVWAMMAALLAAALWLNLATVAGAPVSTTHSIVGGVMGGGMAAAGFGIVDWGTMGAIVSSWIISPLMGGIIAASFLLAIKKTIIFRDDKIQASYRWVPIYVSVMAWAFSTYLVIKGLKQVWGQFITTLNGLPIVDIAPQANPSFLAAALIGFLIGVLVFWIVKKSLASNLQYMKNDRASVNAQFTIPLIFAAALLSFAHGANDVANAIGPLAAINDAIMSGGITDKAGIPLWIMAVGALGIAIGLGLYGPRLIRTVGGEITELDQMRAYSIAMAAALTVIIASQLGLPVSTTHIAIGGVFGVGFLREWLDESNKIERQIDREKAEIKDDKKMLNALRGELKKLEKKPSKTVDEYQRITELYRLIDEEESALKKAKKVLKKEKKNLFVKRDMVKKIVTAWVVTVPAAATLSACIFFMIRGIML
ncbi:MULTISPECIES: inorganic phosphate transporter [unclassified Methylophaga]|uniref:inorganic phosphate transporter n=1 Tax=unclassified Methylophaga TaxID=2629249 RepID=UPI000C8AE508|nr:MULTISPECIES: inorganic phosphate transporter [unclassified Methylophaga]MAL50054.1 inorganic phosphate transporter [Methylophaga sp.]MAP27598.1 inorganic phosphate transporter [Methylophaga sp.]HBX59108.1 inorganic phosphate transporter [Methylophaga sp.]HCN99936.1 inorganic phosphate transporter [Methylophaga sp.]